ncbi:uncharacterized protein SPAPADRAFT_59368 [Spathaspora passalidarum NRRL Y-27907]|uniref:Sec39 domain-containing protein n=1 Tax=Spathaspora passalidarum (strain NRRL Y-27907 / 11-Y1) TaxID=619300 RepID=G3AJQ5_SPAPN|nr:uncharacterized protein SPAPADRAFT_59368 [Spathaspora passalidarum NRRL Y-27907]EGW33956.1 hypothetical protein SPAPADRAFT_59368 [Spathaspora passalidarum NRRL Y-27907]
MFSDLTVGLAKYKRWFTIIKSIVHSEFTSDDYREIIEWYIISCYYYAHKEDSLPSIEIINIYDVIYDTLSLFDQPVSVSDLSCADFIGCDIDIPQQLSTDSFKKVVSTCQNLFPITKLTIVKYLQYNQSVNNKDITKLISTLNHTNYHQLMPAITALKSQFNLDHGLINKLIIERLLASNLFDEVKEYQSELSSDEFFSLVIDKFWTSFNSATNLNDKIGHLHESKQCLDLSDSLQLNEENHDLIVRLKHLFKAMTNLKNFKIVVDKSKPFTPGQLLSFKDDLIGLITVILQQNPKSYLAFEKLFKIINDLALYFQAEGDFFNKVKIACIESSLIDDNFEYAYTHTKQLFTVNVDELWIIFYQVGKYISPNWTEPNINVLVKQREILSLTLKHISENNKIILDQWEKVNSQIEEYSEQVLNVSESKEASSDDIVENISTDKISNLLVSGLGWAIGAHHR